MRTLFSAALCLVLSYVFADAQEMRNMSILTGAKTGTYYRFGTDIADLLRKECGAEIAVKESQGSLANLQRLRHEANSQLAIVQQDSLDYLKKAAASDPKLQEIARAIRLVFPLYSEEVHLVTTRATGIKRLKDISGKRVAVGEPESGTYLTSSFVLLLAGIEAERVQIGQVEALRRLLLPVQDPARIDALFYVAGAPVKLFAENPALKDQLSGVAIDEPAVLERYNAAQLTSEDYGWIDGKVDTIRVRSVLMTYDFKLEQCANVGMVANRIKANLKALKSESGHPKWAEVEVNAPVAGWQIYRCVAKYLDAPIGTDNRQCMFTETASTDYMPPGQKAQKAAPASVCGNGKTDNPIVQSLCRNLNDLQK
jgi:TRAP transporter TAXI family solute receptor